MSLEKIGYRSVATTDGPTQLKTGPSGFFGFVVSVGAAASIAVYDGTSASGKLLYTKAGHVAGDVVHFGGVGIAANQGLFIVVGGASSEVNFLYA